MPGGRAGGGGHSSGGGRIGGGGGRIGGGSGRIGGGSRPSGGFSSSGSGGSGFWQGMMIGSMLSNQNRPSSYQGQPHSTGYNTQQGPFHQQPTFGQTPQQQQYQQATDPYHKRQTGNSGCVTVLIFMLVFFLLIALLPRALSSTAKSTVERTKLDSKYVTKTAYFNDTAGWISSSSTLEKGLRSFYEATGVQPYLYVTEDINGDTNPSSAEMDAFWDAAKRKE